MKLWIELFRPKVRMSSEIIVILQLLVGSFAFLPHFDVSIVKYHCLKALWDYFERFLYLVIIFEIYALQVVL